MEVFINGRPHGVPAEASLAALLDELCMADRPIAVEVNRELVPWRDHAAFVLHEGDRLEMVTLVGGG